MTHQIYQLKLDDAGNLELNPLPGQPHQQESDYITDSRNRTEQLNALLAATAIATFTDDYRQSANNFTLKAESFAHLLTSLIGYDGEQCAYFLFIALAAALEDCNWHTEAGIVYDLLPLFQEQTPIATILKPLAKDG